MYLSPHVKGKILCTFARLLRHIGNSKSKEGKTACICVIVPSEIAEKTKKEKFEKVL